MEFNPDIYEVLKEYKINKDDGLLVLLGYYHGLEIERLAPESIVKAISLTKILERDYTNNTTKWNMPLFKGQNTAFDWVTDWIDGFGKINPERRGSPRDVVSRMQDFFKKYPEWRKEDVYAARDMYFRSVRDSKFLMKSHKFIFDGAGAMKKSILLSLV
jgi:hypothetical protein